MECGLCHGLADGQGVEEASQYAKFKISLTRLALPIRRLVV